MDIIDVALAKAFALKVAAGFSNVEIDGTTIIFTLNDGSTASMTIPTPANGVSVTDLNIDDDGSLLCTMSDGTIIDAGGVPSVKPEKGVDYFTPEEVAEFKEAISGDIDTALAAIQSVEGTLTDTFSTTTSYMQGDIVVKNHKYYKAKESIQPGE